jgi:hypothetical protein
MHGMHDAIGVIDTAFILHAVSMTPHAKYDTACTIDERFPLKGISIQNVYAHELAYPTTTKIYKFKGATKLKFFLA